MLQAAGHGLILFGLSSQRCRRQQSAGMHDANGNPGGFYGIMLEYPALSYSSRRIGRRLWRLVLRTPENPAHFMGECWNTRHSAAFSATLSGT